MDRLTLAADVVGWLQDREGDIEDFTAELAVVDWVLIALACALVVIAVVWVGGRLRSLTRLGPIEVAPLDHDGEHSAKVLALTASLREQLARTGLVPPPSVPAGGPQANLIAAVEASPIPQARWIGTLLAILPSPPRPPRYKVTGTLCGEEPTPQGMQLFATVADPKPCGISFWLNPEREGTPLLDTVGERETHSGAITTAASRIYLHISKNAVHAFPLWVRWRTESALEAYLGGCRKQTDGKWAEAARCLNLAAAASPYNALARLQVANLYEQRTATTDDPLLEGRMQAEALRRYLEIARDWPGLVEARYRASVVASTLGATMNPTDAGPLSDRLRLMGTNQRALQQQLRDLGRAESSAVLQLLRPWYALLHDRRLRNQFEPKAHERRVLKHVIRISKHCVRLRGLSADARFEPWLQEFVVHKGHMLVGRSSLNWQAYYNAASFDGVLLKRERDGLARSDRIRDLRNRALNNLQTAIREAGPELSSVWVARADPDLAYFRTPLDERFQEIAEKLPQAPVRQLDEDAQPTPALLPPVTARKRIELPVRPWGNPGRRFSIWLAVVVAYALAWTTLVSTTDLKLGLASALLLVPLAVAIWRLLTAALEQQRVDW